MTPDLPKFSWLEFWQGGNELHTWDGAGNRSSRRAAARGHWRAYKASRQQGKSGVGSEKSVLEIAQESRRDAQE